MQNSWKKWVSFNLCPVGFVKILLNTKTIFDMKFSTFYNLVMGIYKKVVMLAGE